MADGFRIERYRRSDREGVFALISAAKTADFGKTLLQQWDWKYDANPFNAEAETYRTAAINELREIREVNIDLLRTVKYIAEQDDRPERDDDPFILLLKTSNGEVAGMVGSLPVPFLVGGRREFASVSCDWMVHPAYRRQHASMNLLMRFQLRRLTFGWGNQTAGRVARGWGAAHSIAVGQTYQYVFRCRMPIHPVAKPIAWGYVVRRSTGSRMLAAGAAVAGIFARPVQRLMRRPAPVAGLRVAEVDSFDVRFEPFWARICKDYGVIAIRDTRYLNWRFTQRPDASYRILAAIRDSEVVGYLVLRLARDGREAVGYLVDFLVEGRSEKIFLQLLWQAEKYLTQAGAPAIVCAVASPPFRELLLDRGYYKYEPTRMPGGFSARVRSKDPALQMFADLKQWYLTMSDGDLELAS
ncbi:MAG TPA: hypothetical protein VEJ86_08325 [Candidatus Binataceae bacterium]|nr:hypothetical protein [Candidatus Binataceae bacterium]